MESGTQLGHCTILSALGEGGMGGVWRVQDTKLGRKVAIKSPARSVCEGPAVVAWRGMDTVFVATWIRPSVHIRSMRAQYHCLCDFPSPCPRLCVRFSVMLNSNPAFPHPVRIAILRMSVGGTMKHLNI